MNRRSLESQRPIMAPSLASKRNSKRYSTYSASPSFATVGSTSTTGSLPSAETGMAEIKQITRGIDRLENKHLQSQRFVPSQAKTDEISKLSLGAKLERALERRMSNQDAVLKVRNPNLEKRMAPRLETLSEKTAVKA